MTFSDHGKREIKKGIYTILAIAALLGAATAYIDQLEKKITVLILDQGIVNYSINYIRLSMSQISVQVS